jgi:hypothetical protein
MPDIAFSLIICLVQTIPNASYSSSAQIHRILCYEWAFYHSTANCSREISHKCSVISASLTHVAGQNLAKAEKMFKIPSKYRSLAVLFVKICEPVQ